MKPPVIPTLDSNVLIYARLEPDSAKGALALRLIGRCAPRGILAAQTLGEFLAVVRRRRIEQLADAIEEAGLYRRVFTVAPTAPDVVLAAGDLAMRHGLQIWDAVIWKAAASLGANLFLSEDLQDGLELEGMRVLNPFNEANAAEIDRLLGT
jgi:predicted nucleic acid-binding protein